MLAVGKICSGEIDMNKNILKEIVVEQPSEESNKISQQIPQQEDNKFNKIGFFDYITSGAICFFSCALVALGVCQHFDESGDIEKHEKDRTNWNYPLFIAFTLNYFNDFIKYIIKRKNTPRDAKNLNKPALKQNFTSKVFSKIPSFIEYASNTSILLSNLILIGMKMNRDCEFHPVPTQCNKNQYKLFTILNTSFCSKFLVPTCKILKESFSKKNSTQSQDDCRSLLDKESEEQKIKKTTNLFDKIMTISIFSDMLYLSAASMSNAKMTKTREAGYDFVNVFFTIIYGRHIYRLCNKEQKNEQIQNKLSTVKTKSQHVNINSYQPSIKSEISFPNTQENDTKPIKAHQQQILQKRSSDNSLSVSINSPA